MKYSIEAKVFIKYSIEFSSSISFKCSSKLHPSSTQFKQLFNLETNGMSSKWVSRPIQFILGLINIQSLAMSEQGSEIIRIKYLPELRWRAHSEWQPPHDGLRPFHQKSICITQWTLGPYVVHIWSCNPPKLCEQNSRCPSCGPLIQSGRGKPPRRF